MTGPPAAWTQQLKLLLFTSNRKRKRVHMLKRSRFHNHLWTTALRHCLDVRRCYFEFSWIIIDELFLKNLLDLGITYFKYIKICVWSLYGVWFVVRYSLSKFIIQYHIHHTQILAFRLFKFGNSTGFPNHIFANLFLYYKICFVGFMEIFIVREPPMIYFD